MIKGTDKPKIPLKFAKHAVGYNKFYCKPVYLPTQYLPSPHQEGGRNGKNQGTNWHANSKQLQQHFAKNCKQATAYISHEVPLLEASGHPYYS